MFCKEIMNTQYFLSIFIVVMCQPLISSRLRRKWSCRRLNRDEFGDVSETEGQKLERKNET